MKFLFSAYFEKQLKKLTKKYLSLPKDLEILQKKLQYSPGIKGKHSNLVTQKDDVSIWKVRLKCQFAKSSDFRVVYAYHKEKNEIELIEFLEIYAKNKQVNHNQKIIDKYLHNFAKKQDDVP